MEHLWNAKNATLHRHWIDVPANMMYKHGGRVNANFLVYLGHQFDFLRLFARSRIWIPRAAGSLHVTDGQANGRNIPLLTTGN